MPINFYIQTDTFRASHSVSNTNGSTQQNSSSGAINNTFTTFKTEQLKLDLDEVEELTSRVRDTTSIDNTRRYSPLLYEYYRKQMELAKSIQCTYNLQCSSLFDAMTLMRKCLVDYSQTVHNPEYITVNELGKESDGFAHNKQHRFSNTKDLSEIRVNTFNDFLAKNSHLIRTNSQNFQLNTSKKLFQTNDPALNEKTTNAIDFFSASSSNDQSSSTSSSSLSSSNNSSLLLNPGNNTESYLSKAQITTVSNGNPIVSINTNNQTYV
jgi:hypothetical protein